MNDTEKNIAILTELYRIADEYIGRLNGVYEGMYTANQLAKYVAKGDPSCASAITADEKNEVRKVVVDTFEMAFPFGEILSILHRMESATGTGHRRYEMGNKRERMRLYCHYNGEDGKPVRKRKELTRLVLPCLEGRPNEVWYDAKKEEYDRHKIFARLSDTECMYIGNLNIEEGMDLSYNLKLASGIREFLEGFNGEPESYYIAAFIRIADYEMVNILATKKAPYEAKRAEQRRIEAEKRAEEEKRNAIMDAETKLTAANDELYRLGKVKSFHTDCLQKCMQDTIKAKEEISRLEEELKAIKLKYGVAI